MSAIPSRASVGARQGYGFAYRDAGGARLDDPNTLARIRALAIPPAWTDVWISPAANGHIQATGRDLRGRKQYRYHERWSATRDEAKYSNLVAFAEALPKLRERIDRDLRRRDLSRDRVIASVIWLLDNTMIRVGNATYARDNKSFGLTTLRQRHVAVEGSRIRFAFKGKSGKQWKLDLVDRRIVRTVRQMQELAGQQLFQYLDENGDRRSVSSQDVNDYLREATGTDFTSKHFRTWGGTKAGARLVCAHCRARRREPDQDDAQRVDRHGSAAARQHPCRLPQMLYPPRGHRGLDERHAGSGGGSRAEELPQAGRWSR